MHHNVCLKEVDAFTESAFKENQAAVRFLEEEHERDDAWLQLASAHSIFSNGLVGSCDTVEFSTNAGTLTAKRFYDCDVKKSFLIKVNFPVITTCEYR
ncbi:hypothetical protein V5N11_033510 [Cardamine amara subsp. amara]|uniref:Uncharacterized protein n=1 Tax=Cardamine amara subsp. amara TaxID=228776 RepID=A0ABD1C6N2_CARAN